MLIVLRMQSLVSIIMPSYNGDHYISKSIESVLAQTYENWELLIADDCSTDNTAKIVSEYVNKDKRIKFLPSQKNFGPAVSRNRAIDAAQGRYIAFLDSDDLWTTDKLSKQIAFMLENNVSLSFAQFETIDESGNNIKAAKTNLPDRINYSGLLKNPVIGCLTAIYDTEKCGKQKMPVIRKRQDFALWLKILKKGHEAVCFQEILGMYRVRKGSVSRNKLIAAKYNWKLYRDIEKLSLPKSIWVFGWYIFNKTLR